MRAFMEKRYWPIFSGVGIKEREQLNESGGETSGVDPSNTCDNSNIADKRRRQTAVIP